MDVQGSMIKLVPSRYTVLHAYTYKVFKVLDNVDNTIYVLRMSDPITVANEESTLTSLSKYDFVPRFIRRDIVGKYEIIVTSYIPGSTLDGIFGLTLERFIDITRQLLSILDEFLSIGFNHGDIHMQNVMLSDTGKVMLVDFEDSEFGYSGGLNGDPARLIITLQELSYQIKNDAEHPGISYLRSLDIDTEVLEDLDDVIDELKQIFS